MTFQGGYAYKSNTYVSQSIWQVIRIGNVKNDNLNLDCQPVFVDEEIGKETQKYLIHKDDILFTMTGTKGKRDYFYSVKVPTHERKLLLNQRVGCLRRFSPYINMDFLCLSLKSQYVLDTIFSTETGNVSQGNIGSESTINLDIAMPPFDEQCRIVENTTRLFGWIDIIDNRKLHLQETIKQAKSKILDLAIHGKLVPQDPMDEPASELLKRINPKAEITCDNPQYGKLPKGWCETTLKQVVSIKSGGPINVRHNTHGQYPIYGGNGITGYTNEYNIKGSTIVIGRVGFYCGSVYLVKGKAWVSDNAFITTILNDIFYKEYLYYLLRVLKLRRYSNSTAQPVISGKTIYPIHILIPPLNEQHRIVAKIEELFAQLDNIASSL